MVKDVYFTLRTGFHVRLSVEETAVVGDIKQTLHRTKLTHFKPENMKFICNGKVLNNNEIIPPDSTLIALCINQNIYSNEKNINSI